jgi:DHA2 family methylenomycin A resistance protein-like MFS transporter
MGLITVTNIASGYVAARWGARRVMLIGFACSSVGALVTAMLGPNASEWLLALSFALCNGGFGLAIPSVIVGIMQEAGQTNANVGAATLNANRQIGSLAGVAATGIILQLIPDWTFSVRVAFGCFAVGMATAVVLVRWSRKKDANDGEPMPVILAID